MFDLAPVSPAKLNPSRILIRMTGGEVSPPVLFSALDTLDTGKKINKRKRHIIVDTMGLLLRVTVHPDNVQDRDGTLLVLSKLWGRFSRLRLLWADSGCAGVLVEWVMSALRCSLGIVKRSDDQRGFKVLPRRWVV